MHNIERSGFHRGQYVGYGRGTVWKIKRSGEGWEASPRDSSMGHVHGRTLSEVSRKIEGGASRDAKHETHRFTAAERSGRTASFLRLVRKRGSHTYASPEVKRTASYKRAERLEEQYAPQRWRTPGLSRATYEKLADAWERAGFFGWADNYRAHVEHYKIGRDPGARSKRFLSLHEAANRWNTYLHTVYGPESSRSKFAPRSLSDYYSLSDDDKDALKKILESARWRPSTASVAAGRSSLYAFSIALRKERERQIKKGPSRDPGTRHRHRAPGAPSFAKQKLISKKIRLLVREGYPAKQAAAIAYRMYGATRKA